LTRELDVKPVKPVKSKTGGNQIMIKKVSSNKARLKRHARIRKKISGTPETPRLNVFRSNTNIYAQIIDDVSGRTLASASSLDKDFENGGTKKEESKKVGLAVAKKAAAAGIKQVVFDRGGYQYHGRVKELADGAREGGLEF
jgi:large subunit ribosomal protein L18